MIPTIIVILGAVSIAASPAAYYFGRRSTVEGELDRRWADASALPPVNPQALADRAEASDGS